MDYSLRMSGRNVLPITFLYPAVTDKKHYVIHLSITVMIRTFFIFVNLEMFPDNRRC